MAKRTKPPDLKMPEALRLWRSVLRDYDLDEAGVELLRTAVMSYDDYLYFRDALRRTGPVYKTATGLIRKSPLVDAIRIERSGFLQAMSALGLEPDDGPKRGPGRPLKRSV